MEKNRYKWHFTFSSDLFPLTLEEGHPDLSDIMERDSFDLVAATLIDKDKDSFFVDENNGIESIIHSISLPPGKLIRIFRRKEINTSKQLKRTIPAFEYHLLDSTDSLYCFAFIDQVFITLDRRFSREWEAE